MPFADILSQDASGESQVAEMLSTGKLLETPIGPEIIGSTSDPIDMPVLPEPNDDPLRRRVANRERGLGSLVKRILRRDRQYTTAEIAEMDDQKRLELINNLLKEEAGVNAQRISNALDRMGFSLRRYNSDGELRKHQVITFDVVVSTEDAHWLHVNMDKLPYGVNSSDIIQQRVLDDLGKSVGHKVNLRATDEAGIWYIIERASGMMGIPMHVQYNDMITRFPESANGLSIPMGMTSNRKAVFSDLDDMVHALVAGETGGGKSNMQNVLITTLAMRNAPDQFQMLLLDMKAGLEFQFYENLPHLLPVPEVTSSGIIEDPDQVYPAFHWLVNKEARHRMEVIRSSGHRSITDYNARRKSPMPRLLVVCDEWGQARLGKKGMEAEQELSKAAMLLRAVGVHIVIGTQTPTKEILSLLVRSNLPTKICFNCNELSASTIVVGDASALGLPVGRCIFRRGGMRMPVQVPYLSNEMQKAIIRDVIEGRNVPTVRPAHDVTTEEMLAWGLHNMEGSLRYQELWKIFGARGITRDEIADTLKALDGKEVIVEGKTYFVEPGAGSRPRRLIAKDRPQGENNP